jgi:asparagine synthase (glutamine-hydrolysing)
MRRNDYGGHISAFRRLTGVIQTDPTADRRVMEFCLSVPEEQYVAGGRSRSLIRNALGSLLPAMVLGETRIGRQSADLVVQMSREREGIASEVRRMRESPLASRCLNVPLLQTLVETWPGYGPGSGERKVQDQYGMLLMRGVSMGRFIRRVEEGSLFRGDMVSRDLISSGPRMSRNEVLRASQPLPEETPA